MTAFGIQLHGTSPMGDYPTIARVVERYPFHELTVHDVVWWRPVWPILALIAQATNRVLVGPDVTHPYLRHPVATASNIAGIDELSGGRAILGLGAGGMLERVGLGIDRPTVAVRECAELIQRFLAREQASFEGEVFRADERARFMWDPPRPSVPIFVGAFGKKMVAATAAWADEIRPPAVWATDVVVDVRERAAAAAEAAGRTTPPAVGCDVWLVIDRDPALARTIGRRLLAPFLSARQMRAMTAFYGIDPEEVAAVAARVAAGDIDGAAMQITDATLDTFVAAGDPAYIVEGLGRLLDVGVSHVTFSGRLGPDPTAAIELLGAEVLPAFEVTSRA